MYIRDVIAKLTDAQDELLLLNKSRLCLIDVPHIDDAYNILDRLIKKLKEEEFHAILDKKNAVELML